MRLEKRADLSSAGHYIIEDFRPRDAAAVVAGFKEVYGDHYLSDAVYDPSYFVEANREGILRSFVARAWNGDVVGHLALSRSAPYDGLWEVSQGIVLPEHRGYRLLSLMIDHLVEVATHEVSGCCAVFGTALTNHTISQRALLNAGFMDLGFEVDYVPARMFDREGSAQGAVATIIQYKSLRPRHNLGAYLPEPYAGLLEALYKRLGERRSLRSSRDRLPPRRGSLLRVKDLPRFDMTRMLVRQAGADLGHQVTAMERKARESGRRMLQAVVNLGEPECGPATDLLRSRGYWFGGLLPRWMDHDGLLLQKSLDRPNLPAIEVSSRQGRALLRRVVEDCSRAGAAVPQAA